MKEYKEQNKIKKNIRTVYFIVKLKVMKVQKIFHRGTEINKMQFSEAEHSLECMGIDLNEAFDKMADEKEYIYISNGFLASLKREVVEQGEWHHFFFGNDFKASKFKMS